MSQRSQVTSIELFWTASSWRLSVGSQNLKFSKGVFVVCVFVFVFVIVFFVGQDMSPHHSDQISGKSEVNWIVFCITISKVLSEWVSEWVSEWQGHLLSCSGQLKTVHGTENWTQRFYTAHSTTAQWLKIFSVAVYYTNSIVETEYTKGAYYVKLMLSETSEYCRKHWSLHRESMLL